MREVQMENAINLVSGEFNRLAMCKRGTLETENNQRVQDLRKQIKEVPYTDNEDCKVIYKKNRKSLLKLLKFRNSDQIFNMGSRTMEIYTTESREKYEDTVKKLYKHKDFDEVVKHNDAIRYRITMLREEMSARNAFLDAEVKDLNLKFITGAIEMVNLSSEIEKFEAYVW